MAFNRFCPGSSVVKSPTPEYIQCQRCGAEVEIWSDEAKATCPDCGAVNFKEQRPSCLDWCAFAKECVGEEAYARLKPGPPSPPNWCPPRKEK